MTSKYISAAISPARRVEILRVDSAGGYWKPGQFGYARGYSTHPGMHTLDSGPSAAGDLSYLVSKSKDGRGGGLWFSSSALRFTGREKAPPVNAHATRRKIDPREAKRHLREAGVDFSRDFHELSTSDVERILETARNAGYKKRKDAPGSTARMYFQYLSRLS